MSRTFRDRVALAATLAFACAMGAGCHHKPRPSPVPAAKVACPSNAIPEAGISACDVVTEPYVRYDDPDAVVFNDLPIMLFFFAQKPPDGTAVLQPVKARATAAASGTCRAIGIDGLVSLQRQAKRAGANAVVNIRATWDEEPLGNELEFGCKVVKGRPAIVWEGTLANVPGKPAPEPPLAAAPAPATPAAAPAGDDATVRLKELQDLYYRGLITREEFERKRAAILEGL
jgi:hypothetical protein